MTTFKTIQDDDHSTIQSQSSKVTHSENVVIEEVLSDDDTPLKPDKIENVQIEEVIDDSVDVKRGKYYFYQTYFHFVDVFILLRTKS